MDVGATCAIRPGPTPYGSPSGLSLRGGFKGRSVDKKVNLCEGEKSAWDGARGRP